VWYQYQLMHTQEVNLASTCLLLLLGLTIVSSWVIWNTLSCVLWPQVLGLPQLPLTLYWAGLIGLYKVTNYCWLFSTASIPHYNQQLSWGILSWDVFSLYNNGIYDPDDNTPSISVFYVYIHNINLVMLNNLRAVSAYNEHIEGIW